MPFLRAFFAAIAFILIGCPLAQAGLVNDLPSCYAASHFRFQGPPYTHLLYVLIDQTMKLNPTLQKSTIDNINRALGPGTKFAIAEFSANTGDHYLNVLHTGVIENPMTASERDNVPVNKLSGFDACMHDQTLFAIHMADSTVQAILRTATSAPNQPNDILFALKTVSAVVAKDPAKQKVVFLVSNGLENSSFDSFDEGTGIRNINPEQELAKARASGLLANFGGARVFVLGAGSLP